MPKSVNSRGIQPAPNPGMIRPPAMLSTVAMTLPRCAALRMPTGVTSVPISTLFVTAATAEISRSVQEASVGTGTVNENIAGVTSAARETGEAATKMQTAAEALSREAERLNEEVDGFIRMIRAA